MGKLSRVSRTVRGFYVVARRQCEATRTGVDSTWGEARIARYDGGTDDATGVVYKRAWNKIAEFCIAHTIDPAALIRSAFEISSFDRPPLPNMICSERFVAAYRQREVSLIGILKTALSVQQAQFRLGVVHHYDPAQPNTAAAVIRSLKDSSLSLGPLFRYCLAASTDNADAARAFFDGAVFEYLFSRAAYDAAWGSFIPQAIRAEARSLIRQYGAKHAQKS